MSHQGQQAVLSFHQLWGRDTDREEAKSRWQEISPMPPRFVTSVWDRQKGIRRQSQHQQQGGWYRARQIPATAKPGPAHPPMLTGKGGGQRLRLISTSFPESLSYTLNNRRGSTGVSRRTFTSPKASSSYSPKPQYPVQEAARCPAGGRSPEHLSGGGCLSPVPPAAAGAPRRGGDAPVATVAETRPLSSGVTR